jgi:hypothetical protein
MAHEDGRAFVERYVAAYNSAATEQLSEAETKAATLAVFEEFYDPDLNWSEAPTSLFPAGRGGGRDQMAEAVALVSSMLSWRRYEIVSVVSEGDRIAAAYVWEAGYRSGEGRLHIDLAAFYRIKDGRFIEILEYPCIGTDPGSTP